jgi:hypothetical protein
MTTTLNASTAGAGGFIATSDNSGILALQTAGTTAITVDTSQNVGIGGTSPAPSAGWPTLSVVAGASKAATIYLQGNGATGASGGFQLQGGSDSLAYLWNFQNTAMAFATNNAERMRIDSSGRLCVNVTSAYTTGSYISVYGATALAARVVTDGDYAIRFLNAGSATLVGSVSVSSSSTAYNTSSDYRLKEDIAPMTGALAKVAQLKPVTYKWKSTGEESQGFIAHELQAVVSDCVTGEKDAIDEEGNPQYQGIDTSFLVATLTAALQETKALIDTQAETINALTARIVAIESRGTV